MRAPGPTRWSSPAHATIADYVRREAGLVFRPGHHTTAEQVMDQAMKRLGHRDAGAFLHHLDTDEADREDFIGELTIGESYFFRDPAQFAFVRSELAPRFRDRGAEGIRMWSAACAAGEEPYSLAILAAEEGLGDRTRIIGSDISRTRLDAARRGGYRSWALRGLEPRILEGYFEHHGDTFELCAAIRESVDFRYLNLSEDHYPSLASGICGMDLVLCRNVLIYFDRDTVAEVCRRLVASLSEDGWLLVGASDPAPSQYVACDVVLTAAGLAYRPAGAVAREGGVPVARSPRAPPVAPAPDPLTATAPDPPAVPPRAIAAPPEPRPAPSDPSTRSPASAASVLDRARGAYARGDYVSAGRLADEAIAAGEGPLAWLLKGRSLANLGRVVPAAEAVARGLERHGDDPELAYLEAALALERGQADRAVAAARRALYLDRDMVMAHISLARGLAARGDRVDAARAFRAALRLLEASAPDAVPRGADGETVGRLRRMVSAQAFLLNGAA